MIGASSVDTKAPVSMRDAPSTSSSPSPPPGTFPKVVIIGAGMAGLSGARELLRRGWPKDKVVVLEASDKFGGRMRTRLHRAGVPCDDGAAYVHGTIGNPLAEVAREAGIALKQVSDCNPWIESTSSVSMFYDGERCTSDQAAATDDAYCELMRRITEMARVCEDAMVPASDAIEEILLGQPFRSLPAPDLARLRLRVATLSLWHGCEMQDMQLRSLEFEERPLRGGQGVYGDYPGPHCVVEGGVGRIAEAVATPEVRECLRLNAPVSRVAIVDTHGAATTGTAPGANSARTECCHPGTSDFEERERADAPALTGDAGSAAALTSGGETAEVGAAAAVGREGAIEFEPPMPEEARAALSRLRMGNYEKIVMEYAEPFWPADAPFIGCCCRPQPSTLPQPPPLPSPPASPPATAAAASAPPVLGSPPTVDGRPGAPAANGSSRTTATGDNPRLPRERGVPAHGQAGTRGRPVRGWRSGAAGTGVGGGDELGRRPPAARLVQLLPARRPRRRRAQGRPGGGVRVSSERGGRRGGVGVRARVFRRGGHGYRGGGEHARRVPFGGARGRGRGLRVRPSSVV
ncbi:unnamed protein product, partial [Scytosiphon promiscuus]